MKGVIGGLAPNTLVIDLTHGIPPQQVTAGAIALAQSWRYFSSRTIFVAVVDPGVGTERRAIGIATDAGSYLIGPDNGLLWIAANESGIKRIVELRNPRYRLAVASATFHGRDIFAPAAAWLARGAKLESMGPKVGQIVELDLAAGVTECSNRLCGSIIYVDHFGNLITNLRRERLKQFAAGRSQARLAVTVGRWPPIAIHETYGKVATRAPLALFGSFEMLEIAVRDGNAAEHFGVTIGEPVTVSRKP